MKEIFIIILIFLNSSLLPAQIEVTGQVKDAQTRNALEFCTVSAVTSKDSLIKNCVTDNNGYFTLLLNSGNYRFIFSFIGYKNDTTAVTSIMENKFIGIIKMNTDETYLKTVSVTATAHQNRIDRDVQVITNKMREGSSDTKDVLDQINGVEYDRFNNTIKVDNDSKVIILVDGMEKDQEYIKNLAPERLERVEVIRNPGGRYALEGYNAVINIILKKDYQGTEIYLYDRSITKPDAVKPQFIPVQNNVSGTINYVYNNLNVYAKYSLNNNNYNFSSTVNKDYSNGFYINESPSTTNNINTNVKQLNNNYTFGADYCINPKHTISFESNLTATPWSGNVTDQYFDVDYNLLKNVNLDLNTQTNDQTKNISTYNSLFYEGKLDENNVINSNFTYSNYHDNFNNLFTTNIQDRNVDQQGNDARNGTKFYSEYTHTFKNKTSLLLGYGNTWEQQNNKFIADTSSSNFKYSDMRHKLYVYYSWDKNNKFSFKLGGAGETSALAYLTTPPGGSYTKNNYLIFQPYADIKYAFSKNFDLKLKYRSGSTYPAISQTNPFLIVNDINTMTIGNPNLRPSVTNKVSIQMDILGGFLTVEPYYHFSNNYITQTGTLLSDNFFEYTYSNAGNYRHYGVDSRLSVPIWKNIFFRTDYNFFRSSINFKDTVNAFNDWTMSGKLIYKSAKSHTVAGLIYQRNLTKDITAEGYTKNNDNDYWILILQQSFFKQKFSVMLVYFLPVNFGVDYMHEKYINAAGYTESNYQNISFIKNMVLLQVSYRFNKGKTVTAKEKNVEKDEQKNIKGIF